MMSRCAKPLLALLLMLALGLGFAARAAAAPPAGLNWEVHGTGNGSASLIAVSSSGPALPQHVGNATYSLSLSMPGTIGGNGVGGFCEFITGSGSVTAADGSKISLATGGPLCNYAVRVGVLGTSPLQDYGAFLLPTADGRSSDIARGGSATST